MDAPQLRLRESPRIAVEAKARLRFAGGGAALDAVALDLSASGMGLATPVATPKPAAGDVCTFELALDGVTVEGAGIVIWSRRARPDRGDAVNVGIRFERLDGAGQRALGTLLERGLEALQRRLPAPARKSAAVQVSESEPEVAVAAPGTAAAISPAPSAAVATPPPTLARAPVEPAPIAPPVPLAAAAPIAAAAPVAADAPPSRPTTRDVTPSRPRPVVWIAAGIVIAVVAALLAGRLLRHGPATGSPEVSPALVAAVAPGSVEPASQDAAPALENAPRLAPATPATDGAPQAHAAIEAPKRSESGAGSAPAAADTAPPTSRVKAGSKETSPAKSGGAAAEPAAPALRARRLLALEPSADASGETLVLRADGPIRRQDVFAALIGPDPPRYLLRLAGIDQPWRPADLAVGSALIAQVRTGLHPTPRGSELHVVLDLTTRAVEPSWEIEGDQLRVRLHAKTP